MEILNGLNGKETTSNVSELVSSLYDGITTHDMISSLSIKLMQHQMNISMIHNLTSTMSIGLNSWIDLETGELSEVGYTTISSMITEYENLKQESENIIISLEDMMKHMSERSVKNEASEYLAKVIPEIKNTQNEYFKEYDKAIESVKRLKETCDNNKKLNQEGKDMNGTTKKTVTINADIFIIPNSPVKISDFFSPEKQETKIREICNASNIKFEENAKLIECWFTNDNCDNLVDHGSHIEIDGKQWYISSGSIESHIPANFFKGLREGDTVDITMPIKVQEYKRGVDPDDIDKMEINLCIHATLNQKSYRYRRFGTFNQVLSDLGIY